MTHLDTRLWHGGVPGLNPGDLLLPPNQTGIITTTQIAQTLGFDPHEHGVEADRMRPDRVYLTPHRELARAYAACWTSKTDSGLRTGYGSLYVARPVGEFWPDPDLPDGVGIECEQAEIVAVYDPAVRMPFHQIERRMGAFIGIAS